jgi:hypothetical protein
MDPLARFNAAPSTKPRKQVYRTRYTVNDRRTIAATAKRDAPSKPSPVPRPGVPELW